MKKKLDDKKEIKENVRWFSKFPLEKRLEISEKDAKTIKILRSLSLKGYEKPKRTD